MGTMPAVGARFFLQPSLRVGLLIGQVLSQSGNPACLMGRAINARRVLVFVLLSFFAVDQPSLRVAVLPIRICRVVAHAPTPALPKDNPPLGDYCALNLLNVSDEM